MAETSSFVSLVNMIVGPEAPMQLMLPFLLSWMLYFAMIERSGVLKTDDGTDNHDINWNDSGAAAVVAIILSFFTARFLIVQPFYQSFFPTFFGKVVVGLAALLGLYTLMSFTGFQINNDDTEHTVAKVIAAMMAGAAFIWAGGFGPAIFGPEAATGPIAGITGALASLWQALFSTGAIWLLVLGAAMAVVYGTGN